MIRIGPGEPRQPVLCRFTSRFFAEDQPVQTPFDRINWTWKTREAGAGERGR